jgi:hypothetical protein
MKNDSMSDLKFIIVKTPQDLKPINPTGIENEQGKKFYENNGWNLRTVIYKKKVK